MILVVAEHNNETLKSFTLNTIQASAQRAWHRIEAADHRISQPANS